ncbi:MAG: hypothetical protein R3F38_18895, partial [Gammaproteobacteria bacterium]
MTGSARISLLAAAFSSGVCAAALWLNHARILPVWLVWIVGSVALMAFYLPLLNRMRSVQARQTTASEHSADATARTANVISRQTSHMAIGSAEVSFLVDKLHKSLQDNTSNANDISAAAEQLSSATGTIAHQAQTVSHQYTQASGAVGKGQHHVQHNAEQIGLL